MHLGSVLGKVGIVALFVVCCLFQNGVLAQNTAALVQANRWQLSDSGSIVWPITGSLPHADNLELSGRRISAVLRYSVSADSAFTLSRTLVWPWLRTVPNNTGGSLQRTFRPDLIGNLHLDGKANKKEKLGSIKLNGTVRVKSLYDKTIAIERTMFPSPTLPIYLEKYTFSNKGSKTRNLEIPNLNMLIKTDSAQGTEGSYLLEMNTIGYGLIKLEPGNTYTCWLKFEASGSKGKSPKPNFEAELTARKALLAQWSQNLILESPDSVLNMAVQFAKIRAAESIFETKAGLWHNPGGESYYAAIWANDQAEYIAPFFPFLGYETGNQASLNAFMYFAKYINPEYKPIPSSIIAEGFSTWNGRGDRGDMAMIAYGASRFALALGNRETAEKLWPLIEWCLEYLHRKTNAKGVISSDSDELEGRFPAGDANLCTSTLTYDALLSASALANNLGKPSKMANTYTDRAKALCKAIDAHFAAKVEGFDTYRYYEGNDVLRAWICMPLTVGIYERKQGTIEALFSPRLWTADGLATQAGKSTFWDRSTLYALRGVFACGEKQKAMEYLHYYSNRRLLGEHVPYPIEAWPEGGQRHLSAESGLYLRVITEGLFGLRPTGLQSFSITPQLPANWPGMSLRKLHLAGKTMDIEIERKGKNVIIKVIPIAGKAISKSVKEGGTANISLR